MLTYRKSKDGSWCVFGPVAELRVGTVSVRKKDGSTKTESIIKVSKSFVVDGVSHAYGYLTESGTSRVSGNYNGGSKCRSCGVSEAGLRKPYEKLLRNGLCTGCNADQRAGYGD